MMHFFDYFWKPISPFSTFKFLRLLLLHSVYCYVLVPIDVSGHNWIICQWRLFLRRKCVSGMQRLETNLTFSRCIHLWCLVLKIQKLLRHKWRKLNTACFHFGSVGEKSCIVCWNEFFSSLFPFLGWSFLVLHFYGNVWKCFPKVIWPRMDWFWGFLLENGFFRWLHICMDWNLQELLNCFSFLMTSNFFDV